MTWIWNFELQMNSIFKNKAKTCKEVGNNWESTKPHLCSKLPVFNKLVWVVKILAHSGCQGSTLTLTAPLKWGTLWTSNSTGTAITKIWKFNLWPFAIPVPVEVEAYTVPHFKCLVNGTVEP